jgi:hypothetical protein
MIQRGFSPPLEPVIVDGGNVIVFEHPQHKRVEIKMPEEHYAVIVSQRGRDPIARHADWD